MQNSLQRNHMPKCVLITGANGGLGRAIYDKFINFDINVVLIDRDVILLESIRHNNIVSVHTCDLAKIQGISEVWNVLDQKGIKIDCLVNNAGIYPSCTWQDYEFELANKVMNINTISAFFMSQEFAKRNTQGSIINISSIAAFTGGNDPIYSASKAAMIGLTKSLAISLAPGVRVNAIAPSAANTPMLKDIPPEVLRQHYRDRELLSEVIEPETVADIVLFLASSASKNITGSTIDVNNGIYLR